MSTVAKTARSSTESGMRPTQKGKRPTAEYTPGAPIHQPLKRQRKVSQKKTGPWTTIPDEILDKILMLLANDRQALSVMLMSMVNRNFRREVQGNLRVWHSLYLHWRGHISSLQTAQGGQVPLTRMIRSPQGQILKLNPSVPRSLPNFQCKPPSIG